MKIGIIITIVLFLIFLIMFSNLKVLIYTTLCFIFFPVFVPFMGRDAMTTGTLSILFLYLKYLIECYKQGRFIKEKYDIWVYLLIIFGAISIISPILTGALKHEQIGPALRLFFSFFAATLLFLVIKNYPEDKSQSNSELHADHIEKLLSLFLVLVSLHILLSIAVKFVSGFGSALGPFLPRDLAVLEIHGRGELERIGSFVFGYESYGEILAVLSPLVLYKIFRSGNSIWIICLLLFSLAEILTVTRSGILLFIIGVIFPLLYFSSEKLGKAFALAYILPTIFFLLIYLKPSLFGDVILRFAGAAKTYMSTGDLIETINRTDVFIPAWDLTTSNLSFFGNGITEFDFHNLYLTTLHQKGIIGTILFFIVLLFPALRLIKSLNTTYANRGLIFCCLFSMSLFLINEVKFEFTRHSSYQQICWGILAIYCLVSRSHLHGLK